ncbi:hypothetical protein NPS01_25850 [Nocardioides psychrotolerans]|uniref:Alginate lyase n=1 Tax=Nocardioides psychrotolerans TaxID=1005945 RepID=A0A1I3LUC2_9ACTN|nr:hypothetical protein NPS01_25850 [Nocardioides psychrotolerans]SFI88332.1 hypothetical protein SAMN05216561_11492 [Nocardioides psychrotolerans]
MHARSVIRQFRSAVGAVSAVVVASLLTVATTAGPARADLVPYVPWSSHLAGWTDEYIPSSDNDCVAGRSNCLNATLKEQSRIADDTASTCSHNAIFARAYVRMTQLYGYTRAMPGYYQDVSYFNHVDAVFARYYTDSYYNWQSGNRSAVPQSWLTALDAAKNKLVSGTGDLLLGMNAHINRDLPYVMAAVGLVAPDGSSRKVDYTAVEAWLYQATAPLIAEFAARFDPSIDDTADPHGISNAALFQMVSGWRENAWRNAEALVSAPSPQARALVAANIEAQANTVAQGILATQSYVPLLTSTVPRDTYCAAHKADAPPVAYAFGYATAWGYAY